MTSSCSFRKLLTEDLKRRIWLPLLSIYLYITYILDFTLAQSNQKLFFGDSRLGPANIAVFWITIFMAVLAALQGFCFLFSEEKTDFYFSLPVKRCRLFFSVYVNGLLFSLIPCVLSRLVCYFIEGSRSSETLYDVWMGIVVNTIGFVMIYHLIICVVLLTGQFLAATCGTAFVFLYGIFTFGYVFQKYSSSFFNTYYKIDLINALAIYVSPYHLYRTLTGLETIQEVGEWKLYDYLIPFLAVLLISCVLFLTAYSLFLKRPAESSGKMLAFQRSEWIAKFVIAIPMIMITGYYAMSISLSSRSLILLVAGILLSSFALNGLLESLFQANVRCFFAHRLHAVVLAIVCLIASASFYFDYWQFDNYSPQIQDVDSAAVYIYGLDDKTTIPSPHVLSSFYHADTQLDSMSLTKEHKEALIDWISRIRKVNADDIDPITYVAVGYRINKNETIYRKYPIYQQEDLDAFSSIYDSPQYKKGCYPLLTDEHIGTRHFVWSNGIETFHLDLTEEENKELLRCLQDDSMNLSMNDLNSTPPIGTLSLVYTGAETGDYLFLYPTFEATLSYMNSLGLPAQKNIDEYEITGVQIFEKFSKTSTFGKITNSRKRILDTTNTLEIQELIPALLPDSYAVNPFLYPTAPQYQALVTIRDRQGKTFRYLTMSLKSGPITDTLPSLEE